MFVDEKAGRMKALIAKIRTADTAYYRDDDPIMTDREWRPKRALSFPAPLRGLVPGYHGFGEARSFPLWSQDSPSVTSGRYWRWWSFW